MSDSNCIEKTEGFSGISPEDAMHLVDRVEEVLVNSGAPVLEFPVIHRFTPGMYIREIFMPAGSLLTSKIHNTEHPYVISKGKVSVWTGSEGVVTLESPHTGITKPGTRRVLFIHEDTTWVTFHVNPDDCEDVEAIGARILTPHTNPKIESHKEELE